jgi:hypothetical protein
MSWDSDVSEEDAAVFPMDIILIKRGPPQRIIDDSLEPRGEVPSSAMEMTKEEDEAFETSQLGEIIQTAQIETYYSKHSEEALDEGEIAEGEQEPEEESTGVIEP